VRSNYPLFKKNKLIYVGFNPLDVFQTLYKDSYYKACKNGALINQDLNHFVLPSRFVKLIEDDFLRRFENLNHSARNTSLDLQR
jgi:hypothetical protein